MEPYWHSIITQLTMFLPVLVQSGGENVITKTVKPGKSRYNFGQNEVFCKTMCVIDTLKI